MKAKFFRYLFHRVPEGICYSGSIRDKRKENEETFCFLYLAGGKECGERGESYQCTENVYDLVILADLCSASINRVIETAENCKIRKLIFPECETIKREMLIRKMEKAGIQEVIPVSEIMQYRVCREIISIIPIENGEVKTLALYHEDSEGTPEKEECVMCVKPAYPENNCRSRIPDDNMYCEMKCALYNDFDVCKRQNQKDRKEFPNGHLLYAEAASIQDVEEALTGKELWKKIRVVGFAGNRLNGQDIEKLKQGTQRERKYVVGTIHTEPDMIKTVYTDNTGQTYFQTGEKAGLCFSGYYVERKIK